MTVHMTVISLSRYFEISIRRLFIFRVLITVGGIGSIIDMRFGIAFVVFRLLFHFSGWRFHST